MTLCWVRCWWLEGEQGGEKLITVDNKSRPEVKGGHCFPVVVSVLVVVVTLLQMFTVSWTTRDSSHSYMIWLPALVTSNKLVCWMNRQMDGWNDGWMDGWVE